MTYPPLEFKLVLKHERVPGVPEDLELETTEVVGAFEDPEFAKAAINNDKVERWKLDTDGGEDPEETWEDRYGGDVRYTTEQLLVSR